MECKNIKSVVLVQITFYPEERASTQKEGFYQFFPLVRDITALNVMIARHCFATFMTR